MTSAAAHALTGRTERRLLWLVVGVIAISALCVALTLAWLRQQALDAGERLTASLARIVEEQTTRTLQAVDQRLELAAVGLAQLQAEGKLDEASARSFLQHQLDSLPFLRAMWVLDARGRIAYDSDSGNIGIDLSDRAYFRFHRENPDVGFHLDAPVRSRSIGSWLISSSRPLIGNGFTGIVVAAIEPPYFDSLWRTVELGEGGAISLLRRDGTLMVRSPFDEAAMTRRVPDHTALRASEPWGSFLGTSPFDGRRRSAAFRTLSSQPDLVVVVGQSLDGLLAPWRRQAFLAALIWALASLAIAALGLRLGRAQREQRRSEESLAITLQSLGDAVVAADAEGRVLRLNPAAERLTGWGADEAQGRPLAEVLRLVDAATRQPVPDPVRRVLERGDVVALSSATLLLARDGQERPIADSAAPIRGADGDIVGVVLVFSDVSARQAAETALRESETRYRELFDLNPLPMWVSDSETLVFLAVNSAAVVQYGYSREEFLTMTIRDIRPPEDVAKLEGYLARRSASTAGPSGVWTHVRKDGTRLRVAIASHGLVYAGRPARLVIAEDITAREAAENERARLSAELDRHRNHLEELVAQRTAELAEARGAAEAANRAKSSFIANMSHEIRTPMNAILGLGQLLRGDGVTPAQAARLDRMDAAGRHLLAIINDILDLSKIEAGHLELERTDFSLGALLDNVKSILGEQARAKGLRLDSDAAGVPDLLHGDPTRLRQALLNYAGNAVKFTAHGQVALRVRHLGDDGDALLLHFEVEDSGIGVDPAQIPRLFRAFEQADGGTARQHGGTGLGLAINRRLAQMMGGEVGAESQPGRGSRFWFTARLQRAVGTAPVAVPAVVADAETLLRQRHGGRRVLLVEDHEVNREVAGAVLGGLGFEVEMAHDGPAAVASARGGRYDLVLMDVQMPGMDGLAATRAIRALPGWAEVPIVALTANAFDEDRRACEAAGMNDVIVKPMDPRTFYPTLLRWLDHGAATTAATAPAPALPAAAGLDSARGLAMLRGDAAKYRRLLRQLVEGPGDELRRHLAEPVADEATRAFAHSLRGAAATLGADALAAAALRVETLVRGGAAAAELAPALQAVADEIARLGAALSASAAAP